MTSQTNGRETGKMCVGPGWGYLPQGSGCLPGAGFRVSAHEGQEGSRTCLQRAAHPSSPPEAEASQHQPLSSHFPVCQQQGVAIGI